MRAVVLADGAAKVSESELTPQPGRDDLVLAVTACGITAPLAAAAAAAHHDLGATPILGVSGRVGLLVCGGGVAASRAARIGPPARSVADTSRPGAPLTPTP